MTTKDSVALIIGAGDATGGAVARRFAREGFTACVVRRTGDKLQPLVEKIKAAGGKAHGFGCDARREDQVIDLFAKIERDIGPIEIMVFNVGGNIRFPILEMTAQKYQKTWEMAAFAGFLAGREAAKYMTARGHGTILFTGASASLRGRSGFSAFAGGKHALRALAQSVARELGPKGIHVAHIVIDGMIDTEFVRQTFPDIVAKMPPDGLLNPDDIAETYVMLHRQKRSAWTQEIDLRPWVENW